MELSLLPDVCYNRVIYYVTLTCCNTALSDFKSRMTIDHKWLEQAVKYFHSIPRYYMEFSCTKTSLGGDCSVETIKKYVTTDKVIMKKFYYSYYDIGTGITDTIKCSISQQKLKNIDKSDIVVGGKMEMLYFMNMAAQCKISVIGKINNYTCFELTNLVFKHSLDDPSHPEYDSEKVFKFP